MAGALREEASGASSSMAVVMMVGTVAVLGAGVAMIANDIGAKDIEPGYDLSSLSTSTSAPAPSPPTASAWDLEFHEERNYDRRVVLDAVSFDGAWPEWPHLSLTSEPAEDPDAPGGPACTAPSSGSIGVGHQIVCHPATQSVALHADIGVVLSHTFDDAIWHEGFEVTYSPPEEEGATQIIHLVRIDFELNQFDVHFPDPDAACSWVRSDGSGMPWGEPLEAGDRCVAHYHVPGAKMYSDRHGVELLNVTFSPWTEPAPPPPAITGSEHREYDRRFRIDTVQGGLSWGDVWLEYGSDGDDMAGGPCYTESASSGGAPSHETAIEQGDLVICPSDQAWLRIRHWNGQADVVLVDHTFDDGLFQSRVSFSFTTLAGGFRITADRVDLQLVLSEMTEGVTSPDPTCTWHRPDGSLYGPDDALQAGAYCDLPPEHQGMTIWADRYGVILFDERF